MHSPPQALDLSPPGGGANRHQQQQQQQQHQQQLGLLRQGATPPISTHGSVHGSGLPAGLIGSMVNKIRLPPSHLLVRPPSHLSAQSPPPSSGATPISHHPDDGVHEGTVSPPSVFQQPPPSVNAAAAFIAAAAAAAAAQTSPTSDHENNHTDGLGNQNDPTRPRIRNRRGRGGRSARSERMAAAIGSGSPRSLSEMSVRGLDLLRYATLAPDGTYRYTFTIG